MSKKVQTQSDYPVDVETAWAALTSEDWVARLSEATGADNTLTSVTDTDAERVLVFTRSLPASMPGALSRIIPSSSRPVQTDRWELAARDGVRHGTWKVVSPGVPTEVGGTMRLEPAGSGSRFVTETEIRVKVPMIGGKLEGFVVDVTRKQAEEEGRASARLLAPRA